MKKDQQLLRIKKHYENALNYINANDYKLAEKEIYDVMNIEDYDLSLDILYNYNNNFTSSELRDLVLKVDNLLTDYSKLPREFNQIPDDLDQFIGDIF